MYTNKLKTELRKKLFKNNKFNHHVNRTSYQVKLGIYDLVLKLIQSTNFLNEDCGIDERLYCVLNDIFEMPSCSVCGNVVSFARFDKGYNKTCSKECKYSNKERKNKIYQTKVLSRIDNVSINDIINSTNFLGENAKLAERVYCVSNNIFEIPTCKCCENKVQFENPSRGYRTYCSIRCSSNSPDKMDDIKNTNMKKYGVEFIAQLPYERNKRRVDLNNRRPAFDYSNAKNKRRQTILERYNGENTGWLNGGRETRIRNGFNCVKSVEYEQYKKDVRWYTKQNDLSVLENFKLRDNHCRNENAYHLDHIVSISMCYNNNISPEIAGSIVNLRFIPWKDNLSKWARSDMSIEELLEKYYERIG